MGSHSYLQNLNSCPPGYLRYGDEFIYNHCQGLMELQKATAPHTLQNLMIGPAWTYDPSVPKPTETVDMGTWTAFKI